MKNPYLCIMIVGILGAGALLGTLGVILLTLWGKPPSEALVTITGGCWGSLGTFLTVPPRGSVGAPGSSPPPIPSLEDRIRAGV